MTSSVEPQPSPRVPSDRISGAALAPAVPAGRRWRSRGAPHPSAVAAGKGRDGTASSIAGAPEVVSLLDLDPDLGLGIERHDWESARQATRAKVTHVGPGEWMLPTDSAYIANALGLIVEAGMISRETALGDHVVFELLAPGDVLMLPAGAPDDLGAGGAVGLAALSRAKLIVLGPQLIHAAVYWPVLLTNLHRRLEAQRQRLAVQGLAAHLPRAEDRVLLTLWLLADRCGRVTPAGIVLPLSLTHGILGRLAAARRPTITLALRALETADCVRRASNGHLILTPSARLRVHKITTPCNGASPIGSSVKLEQTS